jgi:hypothetical protein
MGKEFKQKENSKKITKELDTLLLIRNSIFNIDMIMLQLKILSKLRHIGKYNQYFFEGIALLEQCIDFLYEVIEDV